MKMGGKKDFNKFMKRTLKDKDFSLNEAGRTTTIKIEHTSGELYSVHPGDAAIVPLTSWIKRIKKKYK